MAPGGVSNFEYVPSRIGCDPHSDSPPIMLNPINMVFDFFVVHITWGYIIYEVTNQKQLLVAMANVAVHVLHLFDTYDVTKCFTLSTLGHKPCTTEVKACECFVYDQIHVYIHQRIFPSTGIVQAPKRASRGNHMLTQVLNRLGNITGSVGGRFKTIGKREQRRTLTENDNNSLINANTTMPNKQP